MSRFTFFLALKHVRRRALQSSLTVLGVAVGVMVLIIALSLTNGFIAELIRSTLKATPHVTLSALPGEFLDVDDSLLENLRGQPEVVALAQALGRCVVVYSADAPPMRVNEEAGGQQPPLSVAFYRHFISQGEHYNSTAPLET